MSQDRELSTQPIGSRLRRLETPSGEAASQAPVHSLGALIPGMKKSVEGDGVRVKCPTSNQRSRNTLGAISSTATATTGGKPPSNDPVPKVSASCDE